MNHVREGLKYIPNVLKGVGRVGRSLYRNIE